MFVVYVDGGGGVGGEGGGLKGERPSWALVQNGFVRTRAGSGMKMPELSRDSTMLVMLNPQKR